MRCVVVEAIDLIDNAARTSRHGARIERISDLLERARVSPMLPFGGLSRNSENSWKVQAQRRTPDASMVSPSLSQTHIVPHQTKCPVVSCSGRLIGVLQEALQALRIVTAIIRQLFDAKPLRRRACGYVFEAVEQICGRRRLSTCVGARRADERHAAQIEILRVRFTGNAFRRDLLSRGDRIAAVLSQAPLPQKSVRPHMALNRSFARLLFIGLL
jgi:hypothetical protein